MHFPLYWARGTAKAGRLFTQATGWSDKSVVEACDAARARAERILLALAAGKKLDHYSYGVRGPMREEVVQRHGKSGDKGEVVVTRNRYGALVLNSSNVMFVDVDDPKPTGGFIKRLFGGSKAREEARMELRKSVERQVAVAGNLRVALYRTKAGFRLLILNRLYDPASEEAKALLQSLGSDPLYTCLTKNQNCFRARLSPKPWRCGMAMPQGDFPRESEKAEISFLRWVEDYNKAIADYATCEFVAEFGAGQDLPEAVFVRKLHDSYCLAVGKPLA